MTETKCIYNSKIDIFLVIFITIVMIISGYGIFFEIEKNIFGVIVYFLTIAFVIHLYVTTKYTIKNNNELIVKSSFLINTSINIRTITKIKKTRNPISSPALSLDRIELFYNQYDSVIISPKNREDFIQELLKINQSILVEI